MKNIQRAFLFGSFLLPGLCAAGACWQLAPSGGDTVEAGVITILIDATNEFGDTGVPNDAGGGDAGDGGITDGAASDVLAPVAPTPSTVIAAGIGFACHIDGSGNVYCWGNNTFGQAGVDPRTSQTVAHPTQVTGIANAIALALGDNHACAVTSSNAVYCWGLNNSYQLGHATAAAGAGDLVCPGTDAGSTVCNPVPEAVDASAVSIAAAGAWTCVVTPSGAVQCWGAVQTASSTTDPVLSGAVACGSGASQQGGSCFPAPYAVSGISGVTQLAVGFDHACAVIVGSQVLCWGANADGQVSPQACAQQDCSTPVEAGLPASSAVALGTEFTCALGADGGTVSCVGNNAYGQLGQPTTTASNTVATAVTGLGPANELVASGSPAACAIVDGGFVECWGNVASDAAAGVPTGVNGLPVTMNALGVADSTFECGIADDHSIWCWDLTNGAGATQVQ